MPQRIETWRPARGTAKVRRLEARPNAAARGYCSQRHKAWREAVLLRDGYACRGCGRVCGQKREAHADHIVPVKVRPDLRYEVANGQCLCAGCHTRKTTRESR